MCALQRLSIVLAFIFCSLGFATGRLEVCSRWTALGCVQSCATCLFWVCVLQKPNKASGYASIKSVCYHCHQCKLQRLSQMQATTKCIAGSRHVCMLLCKVVYITCSCSLVGSKRQDARLSANSRALKLLQSLLERRETGCRVIYDDNR